MYVKAIHADGSASLYEVSSHVTTGHHFATDEQPDARTVLGFDDWKFSAEWRNPFDATGQYEQPRGTVAGDCWELRYAWWASDDGVIHAVITPHHIYVLGDSGKTIDRV